MIQIIGVPKERKNGETRVGIDPKHVALLAQDESNLVFVEHDAGLHSGFYDHDYRRAGAVTVYQSDVWRFADIIVKVKEPLPEEYQFFRPCLTVMGFFHFAGNPELKKACYEKNIIAVPYEDLGDGHHSPILTSMSKIAGELSADIAETYLKKENGGKGAGLSGAKITILGWCGVAGYAAYCTFVDRGVNKFFLIDIMLRKGYGGRSHGGFEVLYVPTQDKLLSAVEQSDVVIGAALGEKGAPTLITKEILQRVEPGLVIVDIAIDEGGNFEMSQPTSHDNPIIVTKEGIIYYGVPNIPALAGRRATEALAKETFPYIEQEIEKFKMR